MPDFHLVFAGRQTIYFKRASDVGQREVRCVGDDDRGAHPSVQDVTVDANDTGAIEPFSHLAPLRQADIKQRFLVLTRVDRMQYRITVLEQQLAADDADLDMGRESTLFIVESQ